MENNNEYMETTLTFAEPDLTEKSDMDKLAQKTSPELKVQKNESTLYSDDSLSHNDSLGDITAQISEQQNKSDETTSIKDQAESEKINFIPSENSKEPIPKVHYTNDQPRTLPDFRRENNETIPKDDYTNDRPKTMPYLERENNDTIPKEGDHTNERPASMPGIVLNMTFKSDEGTDKNNAIIPEDLVKYDVFISYNWGIKAVSYTHLTLPTILRV